MELLDCTLRDGANIIGAGFDLEITEKVVKGLISSGIKTIELGHSSSIGGNFTSPKMASASDTEYLECISPYLSEANLGMFCQPRFVRDEDLELAAGYKLGFLRIGTNAGEVEQSEEVINKARNLGLEVRYSLMKAYALDSRKLAEDARKVESYGAQGVTIMDSAGYMLPEETGSYVKTMVNAVTIPVGFHGHNNMGLSVANALAAYREGAFSLDCSLMGLARSAGNAPTEVLVAALKRTGHLENVDIYTLFRFIEKDLLPVFAPKSGITPLDLTFGFAGFHSNFLPLFRSIAEEEKVDLKQLIVEVSKKEKSNPSEELIRSSAKKLN